MNKWPDFLFTVTIRFIGGVFIGCLACVLFTYRVILAGFSHDNVHGPILWLILCGVIGGLVTVFTIPHWQTPWYKGIQKRKDDNSARHTNSVRKDNISGPRE
ncbi:MAG TPA: hypothetical protein VNL17_04205 [Verrucomicrobiae bacterium]|nr:hypothetical protein [Verrucomicrobiae bacterium]